MAAHTIVVFGGNDGGGSLDDTWTWDGAAWTAQRPSQSPSPRWDAAAAGMNGSVVLFGGEDTSFEPLDDTWVWDGSTWNQQHPAHAPAARRGAVAATLGGQVVLFGGDALPDPNGDWVSQGDTWTWDGADWIEQHPATSPPARDSAVAATAGGVVVLFGGDAFGGAQALSDTWTYDGSDWTEWSGPGPAGRLGAAMASQ